MGLKIEYLFHSEYCFNLIIKQKSTSLLPSQQIQCGKVFRINKAHRFSNVQLRVAHEPSERYLKKVRATFYTKATPPPPRKGPMSPSRKMQISIKTQFEICCGKNEITKNANGWTLSGGLLRSGPRHARPAELSPLTKMKLARMTQSSHFAYQNNTFPCQIDHSVPQKSEKSNCDRSHSYNTTSQSHSHISPVTILIMGLP